MTPAREAYEQGYADTVQRTMGILAVSNFTPRREIPFDGGKVMYLRGMVAKLQETLDNAKSDLMAAERKLDELVSISED